MGATSASAMNKYFDAPRLDFDRLTYSFIEIDSSTDFHSSLPLFSSPLLINNSCFLKIASVCFFISNEK